AYPRASMDGLHLRRQDAILTDALTEGARTPCVIVGPRHLEHPTHRGDAPDELVRADEHEPHRAPLAKKAVAFFRISRSSRKRSFSRLSWRTCSSRDSTRP